MTTESEDGAVKSAVRVLEIFEFLAKLGRPATHGEIADALAIPKSSLTKLLKTLSGYGYLDMAQAQGGFRIGPRLTQLIETSEANFDIAEVGLPTLKKIAETLGESAALNQLHGEVAEVVATASGQQRLSTTMRLGDVAPLYATSGGKVILAYMPDRWVEDYLGRVKFKQITANTISDPQVLRHQLEQIREIGFAYSYDEFTPGITGVAKAVLSASGTPLASLNVTIPSARFTEALRETVEDTISKAVAALERHQRRRN
ncbi:IclR family transcriptional regulator [Mesorhizobium sp. M3A.F.Ca.ET.201.01.1.1]|uniref:IclR family transcriptional regulator n=1 Tax=Mesorhizobium sp. M3A.F.Ca.ET.201.01.1.1 TaxID=2563946 RepID=UPI001093B617|nr:IclR family transcriptional regulator [Mesorhizobium sp. M3A.F.Ca.ET.201.01.1.1]TGS71707.1 IclR family transcriptional regulator [Mesorhizobium sp. M3A.F.Ca.ET.201.01.1.1]